MGHYNSDTRLALSPISHDIISISSVSYRLWWICTIAAAEAIAVNCSSVCVRFWWDSHNVCRRTCCVYVEVKSRIGECCKKAVSTCFACTEMWYMFLLWLRHSDWWLPTPERTHLTTLTSFDDCCEILLNKDSISYGLKACEPIQCSSNSK